MILEPFWANIKTPDKVGPRYHKNGFLSGEVSQGGVGSNGVALHLGVAATLASLALHWAT